MSDRQLDFDILIVGSGGAGTAAAILASELGARTAIVEGAKVVGGTCVNVGCIPSKYLIEAAARYHATKTSFPGITTCEPQVAWEQVLQEKQALIETLRQQKYVNVLASYEGVELLRGEARLLGGGRVQVGADEVRAGKIILATGASPVLPTVNGLDTAGALNSTTAMELQQLPSSLLVIGAGPVGLELGQTFARFGVKVTVLEMAPRILPVEDRDVAKALADALTEEGISIRSGVRIEEVLHNDAGRVVVLAVDGSHETLEAEQLLVAAGRRPDTSGLGLEAAGVELDGRGFIQVDEFMRTSNPDILAAGDVTGAPQFVYVAALTGAIAAQAALSEKVEPVDLTVTPRVTFTDPQVAAVGLTEEEASAMGLSARVTSLPVKELPRAAVSRRGNGVIKLVAETGSDRLLGAHVLSPNAGNIIGEVSLAIRFGLTANDLVSTLHPYLTWAEGMKLAAQTFTKDVTKLSCCA